MIIMKFGGSSLFDEESLHNVVSIISKHKHSKPVIVISAIGKTTRKILNIAQHAANNKDNEVIRSLDEIESYHLKIFKSLSKSHEIYQNKLIGYLAELRDVIEIIMNRKEVSSLLLDKALSYGELMSTIILVAALNEHGLRPKALDARICIITNNHFTQAHPEESECIPKIREYILPVLEQDFLPVIQGFIGSTHDGETTTLGFEGSDYSAVILGSALNAQQIQIWKDVPGVMSADPSLIKNARPLKELTFDEAEELSLCGAKILHPKTIGPARKNGINMAIYNCKNPEAAPTIISPTISIKKMLPKSITYQDGLCVWHVKSKDLLNNFEFYAVIFNLINQHELTPIYVLGREKNLFIILKKDKDLHRKVDKLKSIANVRVEENLASISLIGENIGTEKLLQDQITRFIGENKIRYQLTVNHKHSVSYVLEQKFVPDLLLKLHDTFILKSNVNN
jgi:aspartate kinase